MQRTHFLFTKKSPKQHKTQGPYDMFYMETVWKLDLAEFAK